MGERKDPLLLAHQYFRQGPASDEGWSQLIAKDRDWESLSGSSPCSCSPSA